MWCVIVCKEQNLESTKVTVNKELMNYIDVMNIYYKNGLVVERLSIYLNKQTFKKHDAKQWMHSHPLFVNKIGE